MHGPLPETYIGDSRLQPSPGLLWSAVAISVSLHLLIAIWWPQFQKSIEIGNHERVLELTILLPKPAVKSEHVESVEATEVAEVPIEPVDTIAEVQPVETSEPEEAPQQVVETEVAAAEPELAPPALQLDRPSDWSRYLDAEESLTIGKLPFNLKLGKLKAEAEEGKARRQLLARRERAVYGLSDEEFGIREGFGNRMIKVDGRCYILREATELGGGDQWSMTGCPDPRQHPMTLPLLEFDAVGRVVAN